MLKAPLVSVIIPVKNEAAVLGRCLESLAKLDYPRESLEIIVADGLSRDDTRDIALKAGVKVVNNEKQVVVSGRNAGFRQSSGSIIAFTDADCVFHADWLKNSIKYFDDPQTGGVGGLTLMPPDSPGFEKAVDFIFGLAEAFKSTCHRSDASFSCAVADIPGCNAIYRREALSRVMPVDESLLTAEDVWMNSRIRSNGYKLIFAPDVILWHFRRSNPGKFLRQMYRFAIGRLQVARRDRRLLNAFHVLTGFGLPVSLLALLFFILSGSPVLLLAMLVAALFVACFFCFMRTGSLSAAANLPWVACLFLLGWSGGFLREFLYPLKKVEGR